MTGEEIIEANKDRLVDAKVTKVGGIPAVVAFDSATGNEVAIFFRGNHHVDVSLRHTRHRGVMSNIKRTLSDAQRVELVA